MIGPETGLQVPPGRGPTDRRKAIAGLGALAQDVLIRTLGPRIAKLKTRAFAKPCETIEQLELALEDLPIASAERVSTPAEEDEAGAGLEVTTDDIDAGKPRHRPACRQRPRASGASSTQGRDCGGDPRLVREDVREVLNLVAAQMKVRQIARLKKSCRRCETMAQAPTPNHPIPSGRASAALLAWILVSKVDDHVPLHRQTEIFARMGAEIRLAARQKHSASKVEAIFVWSESQLTRVPG